MTRQPWDTPRGRLRARRYAAKGRRLVNRKRGFVGLARLRHYRAASLRIGLSLRVAGIDMARIARRRDRTGSSAKFL